MIWPAGSQTGDLLLKAYMPMWYASRQFGHRAIPKLLNLKGSQPKEIRSHWPKTLFSVCRQTFNDTLTWPYFCHKKTLLSTEKKKNIPWIYFFPRWNQTHPCLTLWYREQILFMYKSCMKKIKRIIIAKKINVSNLIKQPQQVNLQLWLTWYNRLSSLHAIMSELLPKGPLSVF